MRHHRSSLTSLLRVLLLSGLLLAGPALRAGAVASAPAAKPTPAQLVLPPTQPATGPGGAEVAYDGLVAQHFGPQPDGSGAPTGYWLFEPTRPRDQNAAGPLPLVLFFHGFDVLDPELYHAWIAHLVRRGAILIAPDYQVANLGYDDATGVAVENSAPGYIQTAVRSALSELATGGHARPDVRRVAAIGHSQGAVLAADYTGRAAAAGLPAPEALLVAMPGCNPGCDLTQIGHIPATTRVVVVVGNQDTIAGEAWAKPIWAQLSHIPVDHKAYVRLIGDAHGTPAPLADHFVAFTTSVLFFGQTVGALDAFDWYGTWKFLDALMSCSFAGKDCVYATGNTPQQRFMGKWSDGVPVTAAQVTENPGPPAS